MSDVFTGGSIEHARTNYRHKLRSVENKPTCWRRTASHVLGCGCSSRAAGCAGFQYGLMIEEGEGDSAADKVFESNGVRLYVDPISVRYLTGAEVDFVDNLTGGGFTIKNPNAKSTCGCGSSFEA